MSSNSSERCAVSEHDETWVSRSTQKTSPLCSWSRSDLHRLGTHATARPAKVVTGAAMATGRWREP